MVLNYLNTVSRIMYKKGEFNHYEKFHVRATIRDFKTDIDDVVYEGCPEESCKKKLQPARNNKSWFCPKCNRLYHDFVWRYKLKVFIQDPSRRRPVMVTMFDNTAEPLLEISANKLVRLFKRRRDKYCSLFSELLNDTFYFILRTALVWYNVSTSEERTRLNYIMVHSKFAYKG